MPQPLLCLLSQNIQLLMKITAELIQQSPQFTNPLNERQLDLRGYKLKQIENLGATLDFYECIDLSDNELRRFTNFTYLEKLRSLILTNNRISRIDDVSELLPNLENLCLMSNKITELSEIDNLANLKKLERLILTNNVITEVNNYRLYVINKMPTLRILDFKKISKKQRQDAIKLFGVKEVKEPIVAEPTKELIE